MNKFCPQSQIQELNNEIWYHGSVTRSEAESMLKRVNTFLNSTNQLKFIYFSNNNNF